VRPLLLDHLLFTYHTRCVVVVETARRLVADKDLIDEKVKFLLEHKVLESSYDMGESDDEEDEEDKSKEPKDATATAKPKDGEEEEEMTFTLERQILIAALDREANGSNFALGC